MHANNPNRGREENKPRIVTGLLDFDNVGVGDNCPNADKGGHKDQL